MNLHEIKLWVEYQLNKHQSGNTLSDEEFNLALQNANLRYFDWLTGLLEEYRPGQPLPAVAAPSTEKIVLYLRPFTKFVEKLNVPATGLAVIPTDLGDKMSMRFSNPKATIDNKWRKVEILFDDLFMARTSSTLRQPSLMHPVCRIRGDVFEFAPKNLGWVELTYYITPTKPVYVANIINDEYVYDEAASTELAWPETCHQDIAEFILDYASTNLREQYVQQIVERKKERGK